MGLIAPGPPFPCQEFCGLVLASYGGWVSGWLGRYFPRGTLAPGGCPGCAPPPFVNPFYSLVRFSACVILLSYDCTIAFGSRQVLGVGVGATLGGY